MNPIKITIPEELTILIQKYDYESQARKDIIIYLLSHDNVNISNERFEEYKKEYDEKFSSFQIIKSQIENEYIKPIINTNKFNWFLDYNTNIITITVME